jgi:hypothetical protein
MKSHNLVDKRALGSGGDEAVRREGSVGPLVATPSTRNDREDGRRLLEYTTAVTPSWATPVISIFWGGTCKFNFKKFGTCKFKILKSLPVRKMSPTKTVPPWSL